MSVENGGFGSDTGGSSVAVMRVEDDPQARIEAKQTELTPLEAIFSPEGEEKMKEGVVMAVLIYLATEEGVTGVSVSEIREQSGIEITDEEVEEILARRYKLHPAYQWERDETYELQRARIQEAKAKLSQFRARYPGMNEEFGKMIKNRNMLIAEIQNLAVESSNGVRLAILEELKAILEELDSLQGASRQTKRRAQQPMRQNGSPVYRISKKQRDAWLSDRGLDLNKVRSLTVEHMQERNRGIDFGLGPSTDIKNEWNGPAPQEPAVVGSDKDMLDYDDPTKEGEAQIHYLTT